MFIGFEQKICCAVCNEEIENGQSCYKDEGEYICTDCIEDYCIKEYDKLSVFEKADKLSMEEIEDISERKLHKCDYHKEVTG